MDIVESRNPSSHRRQSFSSIEWVDEGRNLEEHGDVSVKNCLQASRRPMKNLRRSSLRMPASTRLQGHYNVYYDRQSVVEGTLDSLIGG